MKRIVYKTKKGIRLDKALFDFLDQTFTNLNEEFNLYLTRDFYYDNTKIRDDISCAEERTLLGLFSNAIVRGSEENITYQEYGVYKKQDYIGRADMFVSTPYFQIIIEAKKWSSTFLKYSPRELSDFLGKIWEQGKRYYEPELSTLRKRPYLMTMVFEFNNYEVSRFHETLSSIREYDIDIARDGVNYLTAYELDNNILMIYGWIE
jgi:hypothetical protein